MHGDPKKQSYHVLIDDPENIDAGNSKVDSSKNSSLFALDVMQKQDEGVEQIISTCKNEWFYIGHFFRVQNSDGSHDLNTRYINHLNTLIM